MGLRSRVTLFTLNLVSPLLALAAIARHNSPRYEPTWDSIDSRPIPGWFTEAKVGIFIHWGVFSVPALGNEWFWYNWKDGQDPETVKFLEDNYPPGFTYADFAPQFRASLFNATYWAELFEAAGAKYVVLTSKHHEGYTLWPSKYSFNWNAMDVGPGRDLVEELCDAVGETSVRFGLYHSMFEWYNPVYLDDKANGWRTQAYVTGKAVPELYEIVERYKPQVIWSDGDHEALSTYWNSTAFLAWLYNESPVRDSVVTNDRWGADAHCQHGGFLTCVDRYNPGVLQPRYWENCQTLDKRSWGFRRNAQLQDMQSIEEVLLQLVSTVSCNGNMLLNVGPTADGLITPIFEERLRQMGEWLRINGEAIYGSKPWCLQKDTENADVWYTSSADGKAIYAITLEWPADGALVLGGIQGASPAETWISVLGYQGEVEWKPRDQGGILVDFAGIDRSQLKGRWAWTVKLEGEL